jgi:phenylacetate-CoA ligase
MFGDETTLRQVQDLFRVVLRTNPFYTAKFGNSCPTTWAEFQQLPLTTKNELALGTNLTQPASDYRRMHQTSGTTTGVPLKVFDTHDSWAWLLYCWQTGFGMMGLRPEDRLFFPFSFGPFLGFWTAFEAATQAGYFVLPGGGIPSTARLRLMLEHNVTVVFCTPTYGLHLAEVAVNEGIDLVNSPVRMLVVAGEPGGCIGTVRKALETAWGARVIDHYGMTEVGPVAFEPEDDPHNLQLVNDAYVAEVLDVDATGAGELVLTNLGRSAFPAIRYRTGDLVRMDVSQGRVRFLGGILGRVDDMIHVRGNNLYPTAIEAILRGFTDVVEFRMIADETEALTDLHIEIEPTIHAPSDLAERVSGTIHDRLLFRPRVTLVKVGALPRFEMKARRWTKIRRENSGTVA